MKSCKKILSVLLVMIMLMAPLSLIDVQAAGKWVTAWTTSPVNGSISVGSLSLNDVIPSRHTVRSELTVTTGGTTLRFQFSNQYGDASITINGASVAKTVGSAKTKIDTATATPITFDESESVTIPAGSTVWSDAIPFKTEALDKISVSMYFQNLTYMKTVGLSNAKTYLNNQNRLNGVSQVNAASFSSVNEIRITSSSITYHTAPFLTKIETLSTDSNASTAVFIGDSTLVNDTYLYYAQRLVDAGIKNIGVVNQAIVGNRLLSKATGLTGNLFGDSVKSRFKRDVLDLSGVKYCFIKVGLNDICHQASASLGPTTPKYTTSDLIRGYTDLINLCHQNGIKVYFFTKSPWKGYTRAFLGQTKDLEWSMDLQESCDALTSWIKTTNLHDGYIDCSPLANPADKYALCPSFTPDGAHLTSIGAIAMADLIPLSYVGVKTSGRTAAKINNVNPYAEKEQIIYDMQHPTTQAPTTQAPTTQAPATQSPSNQEATTNSPSQPATTAPSEPSGSDTVTNADGSTVTTGSAGNTVVVLPEGQTLPAEGTTSAPVTEYTVPTLPAGAVPVETESYVYNKQDVNYNVKEDDLDGVSKIGSGSGIGFILILFLVIVVVGAVVMLTVTKKKEPEFD